MEGIIKSVSVTPAKVIPPEVSGLSGDEVLCFVELSYDVKALVNMLTEAGVSVSDWNFISFTESGEYAEQSLEELMAYGITELTTFTAIPLAQEGE